MLTGSCLCGKIKYQVNIDNKVDALFFCHCQRCRKWNGAAYNTAIPIEAENLMILNGKDHVKAFSINGVNRYFCSECGSNLFTSRDTTKGSYRLRIGTLETPIYPKQKIHIYTDSKANWDTICDGGTQFAEQMK